jgi:TrmH family RNA methyltransferase
MTTVIESPTNPLIKEMTALHRRKEREAAGLILVEGLHPIEEALRAGLTCRHFFYRQDQAPEKVSLPEAVTPVAVSERAMAKLGTTESAPPYAAVFTLPKYELEVAFQVENPMILVLEGLQDPGNLGTIIRSAVAFGATAVITTAGTVDFFNPKVIRASAGLVFALPAIESSLEIAGLIGRLRERDLALFLTSSHGERNVSYREVSYRQPCALWLGHEGRGLSVDFSTFEWRPQDAGLLIPMHERVESLNVAVSASIILAEAAYQRGLG